MMMLITAFLIFVSLLIGSLQASTNGYVPTDAGRIFYEARGSGPAMILIGGGGFVDRRQWDRAFDVFSKSYRVVRYDPLSTGQSDTASRPYSNAENLATLMDSLRIRRAVLIGLSFGAEIALEFAVTYPQRASALIVSAPVGAGFDRSEELKAREALFAQSMDKGVHLLVDALYQDPYFIPSVKYNRALFESFRNLAVENYKEAGIQPTALIPAMIDAVRKIRVPTLITVGEYDHPDIHRRMMVVHRRIPNSELAVIPNSGHMVNLENPDELNRRVARFLETIPKTSVGYVRAVSGNLYYEERGSGRTIIFIGRGAFMDSRQWDLPFEALSQDYHVVRYDPAGFGRSDLPSKSYTNEDDLKALCDTLEIDRAVIVGVSFGGGIAMEFALKYPESVDALILSAPAVSGFAGSDELQKQNEKFMAARSQGTEALLRAIVDDDHFIPAARKDRTIRERFRTIVRANQRKMDPTLLKTGEKSLFDESGKIAAPVLLIIGERDNPGLYVLTKELQSRMPKAVTKVIKNAGHVPHVEASSQFIRRVAEFVNRME